MSEHPTPPAGTPIVFDVTAILGALADLRSETAASRRESRDRGEETASKLERLDKKVDKMGEKFSLDDEALRLSLSRLEQRQIAADEASRLERQATRKEIDELREELRKDREARTDDQAKTNDVLEAMKRAIESTQQRTNSAIGKLIGDESIDAVVAKHTEPLRAEVESIKVSQDRLQASDAQQTVLVGAIVDELGIRRTPSERPDGGKADHTKLQSIDVGMRQGKLVTALVAVATIANALVQLLVHH